MKFKFSRVLEAEIFPPKNRESMASEHSSHEISIENSNFAILEAFPMFTVTKIKIPSYKENHSNSNLSKGVAKNYENKVDVISFLYFNSV